MNDDFFVGYQKSMPGPIAAFLRIRVIALGVLVLAVLVMIVTAQNPFALSAFEFGKYRTLEGFVSERPYPTLLLTRPGRDGSLPSFSRYYLVAKGKHGAGPEVAGLDGKHVRLSASLIYRDNQTMAEIKPGSVQVIESGDTLAVASRSEILGTFTLHGEIVDSKCFMGVMNPGNLKTHRSCAVRCISGGCPPVLLVRDTEGRALYFLLAGPDGQAVNQDVLELVAEPIEVTGTVEKHGDLLLLKADPKTYRRL